MTKASNQSVTRYMLTTGQLPQVMSMIIHQFSSVFTPLQQGSCLPVYIGIDVDFDGRQESVPVLRKFFKALRPFHQRYFVRFVCETLWVMEGDGSDIFYGHGDGKQEWCHLHWSVSVLGSDRVELTITNCDKSDHLEITDHLAATLRIHTPQIYADTYLTSIGRSAVNLYQSYPVLHQATSLSVPLHVLMIGTLDGMGFHVVPIYGMTYHDAKRRYTKLCSQVTYQHHHYPEYFPIPTKDGCLFHDLIMMMVRENKEDVWDKNPEELYALAEYLFCLYAKNSDFAQTDHDILVFKPMRMNAQSVDVFRYDLRDLASQ